MQALFGPLVTPLLNKVQHRNKVYQTVLPIPDISTAKPEYSVVRMSLFAKIHLLPVPADKLLAYANIHLAFVRIYFRALVQVSS